MMARDACIEDVPAVLGLIRELAEYHLNAHEVTITEDDLRRDFFGEATVVFMTVVEIDGVVRGYTICNLSYSSRVGKHRIYMADLCVSEKARGLGAGRALMADLAKRCVDNDYERLEWKMQDGNPYRGFYETMGGVPREDMVLFQVIGDGLPALAGAL